MQYRVAYGAALLVPVLGWGLFQLTSGSQVSHVHLRRDATELHQARRRAQDIEAMVGSLQDKSAREKLEAVHDGATRTHEIGYGTDESVVRQKR
jgi:hypothetical protein